MTHLNLTRAELSDQYMLRTPQWNNNLVRKSVTSLTQEIKTFLSKARIEVSGLIRSYRSVEGLKNGMKTTVLPSYLDLTWKELKQVGISNVKLGLELQTDSDPESHLRNFITEKFRTLL